MRPYLLLAVIGMAGCGRMPDHSKIAESRPLPAYACPTDYCATADSVAFQNGKIVAYYQNGWQYVPAKGKP